MPTHALPQDVDMPQLAEVVEKLTNEQVHALPFGVIRLDAAGNVVFYSDAERAQSGYRKEALSRHFFLDVAPCLNNAKYRGRIDQAMAQGQLDIAFDDIVDLPNGAKDVDIHVRVQSASGGGCWIFTKIED